MAALHSSLRHAPLLFKLSVVVPVLQASVREHKQARMNCVGNEESSQGDPRGDQAEPDKADGMENWRVAAGSALLAACRQGAFKQAIEAVQLFMPGCPLIGCLRFLQARIYWAESKGVMQGSVEIICRSIRADSPVGCYGSVGHAAGTVRWRLTLKHLPTQ